jgi:hypothetical protein
MEYWQMPTTCEIFIWADEEDEIFGTDEVGDGITEMKADVANFFRGY